MGEFVDGCINDLGGLCLGRFVGVSTSNAVEIDNINNSVGVDGQGIGEASGRVNDILKGGRGGVEGEHADALSVQGANTGLCFAGCGVEGAKMSDPRGEVMLGGRIVEFLLDYVMFGCW